MPHLDDWEKLIIGVLITTVGWLSVALLTKPTDMEKLKNFYRKVYPGGPGWKKVYKELKGEKISGEWDVPYNIINLMLGIIIVYSTIFSTGYWIYGNIFPALVSTGMMIISSLFLIKRWKRLKLK
jgi:hypothetical protein